MTSEKKRVPAWIIVVYIAVMTVGFMFGSWTTPWWVRHVAQVFVIGLGFLWLLIRADFQNICFSGKFVAAFGIPFMGILMISTIYWLQDFQDIVYITRGFSTILYHVISLLSMCAAVYLFGDRAVEYTLIAMILANLTTVAEAIYYYGAGELVTGLIELAKTGGTDTTPVTKVLEIHDLTFAFGLMLIYYLFFTKGKKRIMGLIPGIIFFLIGYKRIAALGLLGACITYLLLVWQNDTWKKRTLQIITLVGVIFCFFYVYMIHSGLFDRIVAYFEIDTMGRSELYDLFRPLYEFSPGFRGHGIGYVTRYCAVLVEEGVGVFRNYGYSGLHNDILTLYMELGFTGFLFWVWYTLRTRIMWALKKLHMDAALALVYGTVYMFVTYATDNTFFYCYVTTIYMLLPMALEVKHLEVENERGKSGNKS